MLSGARTKVRIPVRRARNDRDAIGRSSAVFKGRHELFSATSAPLCDFRTSSGVVVRRHTSGANRGTWA